MSELLNIFKIYSGLKQQVSFIIFMKSKNKRGVQVEPNKAFVAMVIVVIVVVIVILSWAYLIKGGGIDKFISLFPDFFRTNYTARPLVECPVGYNEVGYVDTKGYISVNGKRTNLYLYNEREIKLSVPFFYNVKDLQVGTINNGIINVNFPSDLDQREFEYRQFFPEEKERRFLYNSKIYEATICQPNEVYNDYIQTDKCVLTCSLVDGVCNSNDIAGKIKYKQLDCLKTQMCYVDETDERITTDKLSLVNDDSHSEYNRFIDKEGYSKNVIYDAASKNALDAILFERISLKLFTRAKSSFCYSFDSDKSDKNFNKGFIEINDNNKDPNMNSVYSNEFSYSGDSFIQFVAWNNEVKIIKRWKFNNKGFPKLTGYDDGKIIENNLFGWEIVNAKVGDRFYVIGFDKVWEYGSFSTTTKKTSDYKIEIKKYPVLGTEIVCIYAKDRLQGAQGLAESWHDLYCNKATYCAYNKNPFYGCISKDKIKASDSLASTFDKSCCWTWQS